MLTWAAVTGAEDRRQPLYVRPGEPWPKTHDKRDEGGGREGGERGREAGGDSRDKTLAARADQCRAVPRAAATVTCHRLALSAPVALTTSITPHHPVSPLDATSVMHPALSLLACHRTQEGGAATGGDPARGRWGWVGWRR